MVITRRGEPWKSSGCGACNRIVWADGELVQKWSSSHSSLTFCARGGLCVAGSPLNFCWGLVRTSWVGASSEPGTLPGVGRRKKSESQQPHHVNHHTRPPLGRQRHHTTVTMGHSYGIRAGTRVRFHRTPLGRLCTACGPKCCSCRIAVGAAAT